MATESIEIAKKVQQYLTNKIEKIASEKKLMVEIRDPKTNSLIQKPFFLNEVTRNQVGEKDSKGQKAAHYAVTLGLYVSSVTRKDKDIPEEVIRQLEKMLSEIAITLPSTLIGVEGFGDYLRKVNPSLSLSSASLDELEDWAETWHPVMQQVVMSSSHFALPPAPLAPASTSSDPFKSFGSLGDDVLTTPEMEANAIAAAVALEAAHAATGAKKDDNRWDLEFPTTNPPVVFSSTTRGSSENSVTATPVIATLGATTATSSRTL